VLPSPPIPWPEPTVAPPVYVANAGDNSVSIVDGRDCSAINIAGCRRSFPAVPVYSPSGMGISEATGTVYVANFAANNVSVFGPNFTQK
jgi:DNA-binding beta-propeller fold protein YncE